MPPRPFSSLAQDAPLGDLLARLLTTLRHLTLEELQTALTQLDGAAPGRPAQHAGLTKLTPSERKVFDLDARGATNAGAARALGVSVKTVQTHRARVNTKLGVRSPAELVRFAAREGLL